MKIVHASILNEGLFEITRAAPLIKTAPPPLSQNVHKRMMVEVKVIMQGKLIAVAYTLRTI